MKPRADLSDIHRTPSIAFWTERRGDRTLLVIGTGHHPPHRLIQDELDAADAAALRAWLADEFPAEPDLFTPPPAAGVMAATSLLTSPPAAAGGAFSR